MIVLPSDPIQAALSSLAIRDFCRKLKYPVRLAGPPSSLRWIPECGCGVPIVTPDSRSSPRAFAEWLEYNRNNRADWSLLAAPFALPMEEAVFHWLGAGSRIAAPHACPRGSANILLAVDPFEGCLDSYLRKLLRIIRPQIGELGIKPHLPGGTVVLELPNDLSEKGARTRRWATSLTQIATKHPILVAQFDPLPASITDLLRGLGPRAAITHISNANETLDLAQRARVWIGPRSPTTALAALTNCRVKLIGNQKSSKSYPESSGLTISGKIAWQGELDS